MVRFGVRPGGVIGVIVTVLGLGVFMFGYGAGEAGDVLATVFGEQYTVRLTCTGGRAFSEYTHGFSRSHARGKMEQSHPGCEAATVTPVRHHLRSGARNTDIRL